MASGGEHGPIRGERRREGQDELAQPVAGGRRADGDRLPRPAAVGRPDDVVPVGREDRAVVGVIRRERHVVEAPEGHERVAHVVGQAVVRVAPRIAAVTRQEGALDVGRDGDGPVVREARRDGEADDVIGERLDRGPRSRAVVVAEEAVEATDEQGVAPTPAGAAATAAELRARRRRRLASSWSGRRPSGPTSRRGRWTRTRRSAMSMPTGSRRPGRWGTAPGTAPLRREGRRRERRTRGRRRPTGTVAPTPSRRTRCRHPGRQARRRGRSRRVPRRAQPASRHVSPGVGGGRDPAACVAGHHAPPVGQERQRGHAVRPSDR